MGKRSKKCCTCTPDQQVAVQPETNVSTIKLKQLHVCGKIGAEKQHDNGKIMTIFVFL